MFELQFLKNKEILRKIVFEFSLISHRDLNYEIYI